MPIDPNILSDESFSFTWDYLDLWSLEEHVTMLKRELPRIVEEERKRIWEGVADGDEHADFDAGTAEAYLDEGSTTRMLTGTALIAIWATFESVVKRCANRIRKARKLRLRLGDIKGSVLEQADKYFEGVLGFKVWTDETTRGHLEILRVLRHALAHANGQLEDVHEKEREQIEKWIRDDLPGLKESSGSIVVSIEFVERALDIVKKALEDLSTRTVAEVQRLKTSPGAG